MAGLFDDLFKRKRKLKEVEKEKIQTIALCPYCNGELEKRPKRKKTCPLCGKDIYVRTSPSTKEKVLVTDEGAKQIDDEYAKDGYRNSWLSQLERYGIATADFDKMKSKLSTKFGHEASDRDTVWQLFNTLIRKMKDFNELSNIYFSMALFLHYEGKDSLEIRQQAARMELFQAKKDGLKKVRILASEDSCGACKEQQDKVYFIDEALEKMPIPCKDCSNRLPDEKFSWCKCIYLSELE